MIHRWHTTTTNYKPPCMCTRLNDAGNRFLGKGDEVPNIGTSHLQHANRAYN